MQRTSQTKLVRQNLRFVKQVYPELRSTELNWVRELTMRLRLSISLGEMLRIDGKWYVTHAGLLRLAVRRRCNGIHTVLEDRHCDPAIGRWVFKATVYKGSNSNGFVGYGDADPSNVSPLVRGAEMRVAETRAVNRALRKAYGIGLCSVEELAGLPQPTATASTAQPAMACHALSGSTNGQARLKDKLSLLIRQQNLNPTLVKAYAAHFCGTETLRGASRELVESFIAHLEKEARENRDALVCKLNSYSHPAEVHS